MLKATKQQGYLPSPQAPGSIKRINRRNVLIAFGALITIGVGINVGSRNWQASRPHVALTYRGHTDAVHAVAWSPDGRCIASTSSDRAVRVWDAAHGHTFLTFREFTDVLDAIAVPTIAVAWSPDSRRIVTSGSDNRIAQIRDASNGNIFLTYDDKLMKGQFASLVEVELLDNRPRAVAWSPDGERIASIFMTAQKDKPSGHTYQVCVLEVWDAADGHHIWGYGSEDSMAALAWSPDNKRIASGSDSGMVRVWDTTYSGNDTPILDFGGDTNMDTVNAVVWSPDGKRIASASSDRTVQVWDSENDVFAALTYQGHADAVNGVAWSPDGKRIASASDDKTVQVWDASNGQTILTYQEHTDRVNAVAWSPDGKRIASASDDKTVQIWDAP